MSCTSMFVGHFLLTPAALYIFCLFPVDKMDTFCQKVTRFGWRIVFFSGIPHPHLLGEPLPESLSISFSRFLFRTLALGLNFLTQKSMEPMPTVLLKPGEADRILAGHPWVYHNSILRVTRAAL